MSKCTCGQRDWHLSDCDTWGAGAAPSKCNCGAMGARLHLLTCPAYKTQGGWNCSCGANPTARHLDGCPWSGGPEFEQIQLRPRTPQEYRAYVQGFLYGAQMTQEARHNLPTEIALETIVEGYRQMVGYPGVVTMPDEGKLEDV